MKRPALIIAAIVVFLSKATPQEPHHYVFYGLDHERITERVFVETPILVGAQLKYRWNDLEPRRGEYDFSTVRHDLDILTHEGKRLFIQLQDVSFVKAHPNVPQYLREDPVFHGGVVAGYNHPDNDESRTKFSTWISRRWDPAVRARLIALIRALAAEFDGKIAGFNFAETSIDTPSPKNAWEGYSPTVYYESIRDLMRAARAAFTKSDVLIYANFMPSDPAVSGDGQAYIKGIYRLADSLGMGVGGPDLLPKRKFQRLYSLPLIAARAKGTVAGMAIQDGNLADVDHQTGKRVTVEELAAYARNPLHLDYLFWGTEEPYWSKEVVPYVRSLKR